MPATGNTAERRAALPRHALPIDHAASARPRSSSASSSARRSSSSRRSSRARCPASAPCTRVWIVSGVLTLFGALIAAELASAYPQRRRRVRLPQGSVLARAWAFSGAGRCSGRCTPASSPSSRWCSRATCRFFVPVGDVGLRAICRRSAVVRSRPSTTSACEQGSMVQTTLTILKVGAVAAIIAVVFALGGARSVRRRRRSAAADARRAIHVLAFPPRRRRRPVRLRRLAHGDLCRRGDSRTRSARFRARS